MVDNWLNVYALQWLLIQLRVLHHAHALFCRAVARGSYLRNNCSKRHKIKADVEALARIVYKLTKSASSIKPMKLAKRKVTPFQAIKLICASESEVQKQQYLNMRKTLTESFFQCHVEKFDFLPTESPFVMFRCVYLEKTLCYGLAHVPRNLHSKAGLVLKTTDRVLLGYVVGILGTNPQR